MMHSDREEIARSLRLAAVVVVSAAISATVVIRGGEAWLSRQAAVTQSAADALLLRTAG